MTIPPGIAEKLWSGIVDLLVEYGKDRLSEEAAARIESLRADHVTASEVQKAIEHAATRFAQEYPDRGLALALTQSTRFYDLPSVQSSVREFLAHPFDPAPKIQLEKDFASVLPVGEQKHADDAAYFFLERLREGLLGIKKLHDILDLMLLLEGNRTRSEMSETLKRIEKLLAGISRKPETSDDHMPADKSKTDLNTSSKENPFFTGGAVPPDLFVGRASTLALIRSRLGGKSLQSVSIVGERRIGKSSVLRYAAERAGELFLNQPVVIMLDLMRGYCHTRTGFMKALRREIEHAYGQEPWKSEEDGDIAALSFGIEDLYASGIRLVLCLDEVEELTRRRDQFDEVLEAMRAAGQMGQVGLLTASAHPLGELCQNDGLLSPFFNIFMQDTLGLLDKDEWQGLVINKMQVTEDELQIIEYLANGHPFYTQIAAGRLWDAKNGNQAGDWVSLARNDIEPHWHSQWNHLSEIEKSVLRFAAGLPGGAGNTRVAESLARRGLLVKDLPFCNAYKEWIKDAAGT